MGVLDSWTKKGLEQGLVQGKREGEIATYLKMLNLRFGSLSPELGAGIQKLSNKGLDSLAAALFGFASLSDLQSWLEQHK